MKFNKILLKIIASFLCLSIFFSTLSPITANAQEIEYLKVQKKIQEQYQEGIPPEDILEALSDKEIKALVNSYSQQSTMSTMSGFTSLENDPEVLYIDSLAQLYYDYYQEHGYFPEENDTPKSTRTDSIAQSDFSKIIKMIGYDFTNSQIAQQLVHIGTLIGLYGPMIFLHMVAILAGMVILAVAVAILYCAVSTTVNDWLTISYINSRSNMDQSRSYSAAVAVQSQNGAEYWKAYLVDYAGLGGIWVDAPITFVTAQAIVRNNLPSINVYTINISQAQHLAIWTYDGSGKYTEYEAHRVDSNGKYKPLNHQHIHAISPTTGRGKTHIFFAIPYLA